MNDIRGTPFRLYDFNPSTSFILVLFWSAECNHCIETVDAIYPWSELPEIRQKLSVVAVSMDETETEMAAWKQKADFLKGWKHLLPEKGINSKVANDYFILVTPVMILIDTQTKQIISLPSTFSELMNHFQ